MKSKLLLFILMLSCGIVSAQDTIRSLIITEARFDRNEAAYVEITNVGAASIQMSDFKFGRISASRTPWDPSLGDFFMFPDYMLEPGQSFTIASEYDFIPKQHFVDPENFGRNVTKPGWKTLADMIIHLDDANSEKNLAIPDSITPFNGVFQTWNGRDCWYIEQHFENGDSVVIDQVGGVFDEEGGTNYNAAYDVAGVTDATYNSILVRKYNVKSGSVDFASSRGIGIDDSEWMPVPLPYLNYDIYRDIYWTAGNHGNYNFDENTLESDLLDVDFAAKVITVPWGTRNEDAIMDFFTKKPGIAWNYHLSEAHEDSAYNSVRNGDKLTIYVCGEDLDVTTFDLVVAEPTSDANMVLPMYRMGGDGYYGNTVSSGYSEPYEVSQNAAGMDTITRDFFGIPFATPVDSLLAYLEKAPKASWEIIWADGNERVDVKNGDILKVTAENGAVKNYFIKVNNYLPNHNAYLSSITWPDIPDFYKGIFGWIGDTIPSFGSTNFNYKVQIPLDVPGIPALVAKAEDVNAQIEVKRAVTLDGTTDQKTVSFTVTAEDKLLTNTYKIQLEKEKSPAEVQPFRAEPFLSEFVARDDFKNNFFEICNPGNQPLDLSNYMFYWGSAEAPGAAVASNSGVDNWLNRYSKYIPGYKWVDQANWAVTPGMVEQDLSVNSVVLPGDVFVMADIIRTKLSGYPWWASEQADVIFQTGYNPWGEETKKPAMWLTNKFHMFKILNDSIKQGLKAANDPNDFELIETFGMSDGSKWVIGGKTTNQIHSYVRKPEYYIGKPGYEESFGTNLDDTEWLIYNENYWRALNTPWPARRLNITLDIGKHFMNEITIFKSTVTSIVYKVSPGYSMNEKIRGAKTGTNVADFLGNIVKADENQSLKIMATADGSELASDAVLSLNDTLVVLSADSTNTTKYVIEISALGLSQNALLSSNKYDIEITAEPKSASGLAKDGIGKVTGFEYGTSLKTILANINVPAGASLTVIDGNGAYVPLKRLNFDTTYVNVTVNSDIYLDVLAEDGITKIVYQLLPDVSQNDAIITSDVYEVVQKEVVINFVPRGTNVQAFLSNLIPSAGASMKLFDKMGIERTLGTIAVDDKVVVTAPNGTSTKTYFISMLATEYITETTYLAYILSNIYTVDQVSNTVKGVSTDETLSAFYSKINPSAGATAVVTDANGNEKTSGDINKGDRVKVTSADGKITVMYAFGQLTEADITRTNNIEIYPNPTSGRLNFSGVENGQRIQIYNSVGAMVRNVEVQNNIERVSLADEPTGMYLIVISDKDRLIGRYKAIKN